jgi:hypothetical protein
MDKQLRRRSKEEEYERVNIMIPKEILAESKKVFESHNPTLFYNFSHYVTCALMRQNRRWENGV